MMLHGAWTYGSMKEEGGDFVPSGKLGWIPFPAIEGGTGDPSTGVGNPASFLALSSKASEEQKAIALEYFKSGLLTDADVDGWVASGAVPIVNGVDSKFSGPDAPFQQFVYDSATQAKSWVHSWDQALLPGPADEMLRNIEQLFSLSISPEQFATNMNAVPPS
jgi:raffinose/stachyose/melibiose transport system substrate-binding protein